MFIFPFRRHYHTLNTIEVSTVALQKNFQALQKINPQISVCPVLKSNAYGHGLQLVGKILAKAKPDFFIVDSLFEAYQLQEVSKQVPILIMGYTNPENFRHKHLPFHYAVYDRAMVATLDRYQRGAKLHIFVDTGMNREGVPLTELREFMRYVKTLKNVTVVGVCSHFADADNEENDHYSQVQIQRFKDAISIVEAEGIGLQWKHMAASAGSLKNLTGGFCNMARVGIATYGITPINQSKSVNLKPALQFFSTLAQIKTIHRGDKVGYNGTFTAKKDMTIGILPAGYYEGIDRRLSNTGVVTIRGIECPIVGRVSMNITTIDISAVPEPKIGEPVCVFSSDTQAPNSLQNAAQDAGTIPYELLVHLAESVRRVAVA